MTGGTPSGPEALAAFADATCALTRALAGPDPEALWQAVSHQAECFERLKAALVDAPADPSLEGALAGVLAEARTALAEARRRRAWVGGELETVRRARTRVARDRAPAVTARFVSRRV